MANFDPKKPLLGQQHFDQAPALHADPYPQFSAHPRSGQKYGATGQTPTSSHVGLSHPSGRGKNNPERGIQPVRAPESSSNSTGRHAVTMADGCVLPVDPPNADRRDPPGSFEISKEHGIPLPDGSVLPVPSSKQRSREERSRLQPPSSRLQERGGGGSLYPQPPRLPEIQVPTPPLQYTQLAQHQPYQHNYGYPYQPYPVPQPAQPFHTVIVQPQQDPYQQQYHYQQQQLQQQQLQQQRQQQQQLQHQRQQQQQLQHQRQQQQQLQHQRQQQQQLQHQWQQQQQLQHQRQQHQWQQHQQQQQQQHWQQQQPERALELRAQTTLRWDPDHLSNNQCFVACIIMTLTLCCLNIFGLPCVVVATVLAWKSAKAKSRGEFKEAVKQQARSKCLNITAAICTYLWVTVVLPLIAVAVVLVVLFVVNQPVNS